MLRLSKISIRRESFNNSWRRLQDLQGQQNQLAKGALVKTERAKIHKLADTQIDALLTKSG